MNITNHRPLGAPARPSLCSSNLRQNRFPGIRTIVKGAGGHNKLFHAPRHVTHKPCKNARTSGFSFSLVLNKPLLEYIIAILKYEKSSFRKKIEKAIIYSNKGLRIVKMKILTFEHFYKAYGGWRTIIWVFANQRKSKQINALSVQYVLYLRFVIPLLLCFSWGETLLTVLKFERVTIWKEVILYPKPCYG